MAVTIENPFHRFYIAWKRPSRAQVEGFDSSNIQLIFSGTLEADLAKWRRKGFSRIGTADVLGRAGEFGFSERLKDQAVRVCAEVVLFCIYPAKLRSVRRLPSGEIDLEAVVADSPASFSDRSYAVTSAQFLAKNVRRTTGTNESPDA